MTEPSITTLQVNKFARRLRHLKNFSRVSLLKSYMVRLNRFIWSPFKALANIPLFKKIVHSIIEVLPASPQKRILFQAVFVSVVALSVTSLTPDGSFTAASMTYSYEYISEYSLPGDILVSDEDGYLVKINPQTGDSNRIGMTDFAVHTIESGESLSVIAARYGVSVDTVMWENSITNANTIRSGQKLFVPPVDGISYSVSSGDNLGSIADKYEIPTESIIAQNNLESETIAKGQSLFLPGAEPLYAPPLIATDSRDGTVTRDNRSYVNASASTDSPAIGKIFIYPSIGNITNGYKAGHYALDIANTSRPPIWAAAAGTVTKASSGTWGGGYGNHVIIDHGNGVQSLYAHFDTLNVYEGQYVGQGDVIGIMGNTGRVYGVTGIHLHWEVIVNGVKQNPGNYY